MVIIYVDEKTQFIHVEMKGSNDRTYNASIHVFNPGTTRIYVKDVVTEDNYGTFARGEVTVSGLEMKILFNKVQLYTGEDELGIIEIYGANVKEQFDISAVSVDINILDVEKDYNKCHVDLAVSNPYRCPIKVRALSEGSTKLLVFKDDSEKIIGSSALFTVKPAGWNILGNSSISKADVDNVQLLAASNGTRYLAFRDFSTNPKGKITVMYNKNDQESWQVLGTYGFSQGRVDNVVMALDINNNLYVAYSDESLDNRATVMYYSLVDKQWHMLGEKPASIAKTSSLSFAINPINNDVYLSYSDYSAGKNGFAKVIRFDSKSGNWVNIGSKEYVLANQVKNNSLAFDKNGNLYLAFSDYGFAMGRAVVFSYSKDYDKWYYVGSPAISASVAESINLVVGANNTLYLAYSTLNGAQVIALYYDQKKGGWYPLGKDVVATGYNQYVSLAVAYDNTLYIAYGSPYEGDYANVASYDEKDQSWKIVGAKAHVSPSNVGSLALAIDADNKPVVAFADLYKRQLGLSKISLYPI